MNSEQRHRWTGIAVFFGAVGAVLVYRLLISPPPHPAPVPTAEGHGLVGIERLPDPFGGTAAGPARLGFSSDATFLAVLAPPAGRPSSLALYDGSDGAWELLPELLSATDRTTAWNVEVQEVAWHPADILLMSAAAPGEPARLYYMHPQSGRAAAELVADHEVPGDLRFPRLNDGGDAIVFTANGVVWARNTNNGEFRLVARGPATEPAFSGRGIAYAMDGDIYQGKGKVLIDGPGIQRGIVFTDTAAIWLSETAHGMGDVMIDDGKGPHPVVTGVYLPTGPAGVSPDGVWVATVAVADDTALVFTRTDGSDTFAVNVPGSLVREPTFGATDDGLVLAWSACADGERQTSIWTADFRP